MKVKGLGLVLGIAAGLMVVCGGGGLLIARGFGLRPGGSAYHDLMMADKRRQAAYRQAESIAQAAHAYAGDHGGQLPGPDDYRRKLDPYLRPEAAEFDGFEWEFRGGPLPTGRIVTGRIRLEEGDVVLYSDDAVGWLPRSPSS